LFARVAADLAYRLPRAQFETLDGKSPPELVNRFLEIVTVQKVCAQLLLDGVTLVFSTLVGMIVLAFYHPWLLGFDVVLLALIGLVIFVLGKGAVATSIKESKAKYQMLAWLEDLAACSTTFRFAGAAELALEHTDRLCSDYLGARKKHFRILMRQILFALGLQAVASTVLLGLGGWLVMSGQLSLGQLVAAELIVTIIVGSFAKLGKHIEGFYDLLASVDKLGALFDLSIERQDGLLSAPGHAVAASLDEVSYAPANQSRVYPRFNLQFGAKERCVVSGPSGCGKSLLLDLLFGLRFPSEGRITIHGIDLRDWRPDALRGQAALVRDIEVFSATIAENVQLERSNVSSGRAREALEQVGLLADVLHLPQGLDTPLTATGYPLTPNQLRKLMLARAIAGEPHLLLIDGLLDSLPDAEGEALFNSLCDPSRDWTIVVVSGRKALMNADVRQIELQPHALRFEPSNQETLRGH
jgi:putative ABC transport system ATP-binding protein